MYNYGLVLGRFQVFHKGHAAIVRAGLELCNKVVILVGSSQESLTKANPFSFELRKAMISKVFKKEFEEDRLIILGLPDIGVGNNDIWGRYVLGAYEAAIGCKPDLYITGSESCRASWFNNEIAPNLSELRVSRNVMTISASRCRELLHFGRIEEFKLAVEPEVALMFNELKEIVDRTY